MKAAAAIACLALVAAVGLDAQRRAPQPPRQRNKAAITVEAVLLAADRIRADRWYPEGTIFEGARALNRSADMDLLVLASESERPDLRRIAVREFGRFETVSNTEFISRYLEDDHPDVRIEAADALVQTLIERPDLATSAAINPIQFRLRREIEPKVIAAFWKALTDLPLSARVSASYEAQFVNEIQQQSPMRVAAGSALVDLLWNRRGRPALPQTVQSLRQWFLMGLAARFWKLATAGYYDGQDITHADEVIALTGSPSGNEFVSVDRFMRDEVGAPARAGSVVMLGHGRDTLDGRLQHLRKERRDRDRRDTVIGWVTPAVAGHVESNPIALALLPGNRIQSIAACPER